MNILITGIHGFVGTNLVKALRDNHTIYGLDIVTPSLEYVKHTYKWEQLDQIPPIDAIIHLAGKAHDTKNSSAAQVYFDINVGLTKTIYDYFCQSRASQFIFFSSVKAAADVAIGKVTEAVPPTPKGPYGESKIAAESYILTHPTDKAVYLLRPCMIHGPGNKGNLNLLHTVIRKGIPWPLGAFENKRSFTSIGNLSFIIDRLLICHAPSGIYNIADDESISTNELITIMCQAMNRSAHILPLPTSLIKGIAAIGGIIGLPLNKERLAKLTENYEVDNSKIKKALGVEKLPISAAEGITYTIQNF